MSFRRWCRALVAEVLSTALLVWLGCAAIVPVAGPGSVVLTHPALSFGFAVTANICAFGEASGAHMNPAVTLAAVLYGRLAPLPALFYVLAQLLGAVLGFGGLVLTLPSEAVRGVGTTLPATGVTPLGAMFIEVAITGMLVLTVCGVWTGDVPERPDTAAALKIGLVVAGLVYSAGPATGASLNPARSFGPALLQGVWQHHWVYWAGPLLGGALAALLHRYVFAAPHR